MVTYHYGDDLISQSREGAEQYFHTDGSGSTRVLTDSLGSDSDSYAYAAFGEVLLQSGITDNRYLCNRISHTDFNGATHTFDYDADNDWLLIEDWADDKTISHAYNTIGQQTSATDTNGTFTYSYDNRDRLTSEVKHDVSELQYGYDETGNRTTLTTVVARVTSTTTYTFDALNRMASVTNASGGTTQ